MQEIGNDVGAKDMITGSNLEFLLVGPVEKVRRVCRGPIDKSDVWSIRWSNWGLKQENLMLGPLYITTQPPKGPIDKTWNFVCLINSLK